MDALLHAPGSGNCVTAEARISTAGASGIPSSRVTSAIRLLTASSKRKAQQNWLSAVARLTMDMRPDLSDQLNEYLGASPATTNPLVRMSIGEIGIVYEALISLTDHHSRRKNGQYFTPDDVAHYMASQSSRFPGGTWLDPCCGIGTLSFHLARVMDDPSEFVGNRLVLIDRDSVALKTAIALLAANFAECEDTSVLPSLVNRSRNRDFLTPEALPEHDFAILNPPYARTTRIDRFRTARSGELYAYFLERVATEAKGFIAITPAAHLGGAKYSSLRAVLEELDGGDVLVFDNVPDTCFRGYKYGSTNTSKTNFVRAAITVSAPDDFQWSVSPIIRWSSRSRARMWAEAHKLLTPLRKGPEGEWAKVMPGTEEVWDNVAAHSTRRVRDLVTRAPTEYRLNVASTPRYYITATQRELKRGSKHVLHFETKADMETAYMLLNSSIPYWWWRCLDGGITLTLRTLLSTPVPNQVVIPQALINELENSEEQGLVTKLNAGRNSENVRRSRELVNRIDKVLLRGILYNFELVYSSDMFA